MSFLTRGESPVMTTSAETSASREWASGVQNVFPGSREEPIP